MRAAYIVGTVIYFSLVGASFAQDTSAPASASADLEHTNPEIEHKIWELLDEPDKPFVSLSAPDFMGLGEGFDIPDGGTSITELAMAAPGGAFDPRDLEGG